MATITAYIRTKKTQGDACVRFRVRSGRDVQLYLSSDIKVPAWAWDSKTQLIKGRAVFDIKKRRIIETSIAERKEIIARVFDSFPDKEALTSEMLQRKVDHVLMLERVGSAGSGFFGAMWEYLAKGRFSAVRKKNLSVLVRALMRYELYNQMEQRKPASLEFYNITPDVVRSIELFLRSEHALYATHPDIYAQVQESRRPKPRGENTMNDLMKKLSGFFIWCCSSGRMTSNPMQGYDMPQAVYGTPYYITIEERRAIYQTDLSHRPHLAIQRDIFVFQCLIGCRIGDLYRLTPQSIISGAVEYIARKTKDGRPVTVRVPLTDTAREIVERYAGGDRLFPLISFQRYNEAIKEVFRECGITRTVTIINPATREEEKRSIADIASSHLARRCFIGNLYKQVKDPNLISSLSGHKEGSRAFARYRDIDEDIKRQTVNLLD